jgi:hypothetical protein
VVIAYNGVRQLVTDPDGSSEGWMRTLDTATRSLGAIVMNEPMGAMASYPNTTIRATRRRTTSTSPSRAASSRSATASSHPRVDKPNGTSTWNWHMGYPMASYLSTSTVGRFDYSAYSGATATGKSGQPLLFYDFIESALSAATKTPDNAARARQDAIVKFISDSIGAPYPFESHGVVAKRSATCATTPSPSPRPSRRVPTAQRSRP